MKSDPIRTEKSTTSTDQNHWPTWRNRFVLFVILVVVFVMAVIGAWRWQGLESVGEYGWLEGSVAEDAGVAEMERNEGGTHLFTNRLAHETSPYLLQHQHNPVDWYPWGDEAFDKARRENKPIFLSVGYSTCYWCHVMEVESFENPEVAAVLNEHFVAIKVDREERPDVDDQYMLATQLITRRGGWPNSVWLTPEGKAWMAGTYFPKPQFVQTLQRLAELWREQRGDVDQQAEMLTRAINQLSDVAVFQTAELTPKLMERGVEQSLSHYDSQHGGFGLEPKFPPHANLRLLIHYYRKTKELAVLPPITHTLDAMWLGGMHDHLGGGFHRYSTDRQWLLPHFEKMLYDNAQLLQAYTEGYLITGQPSYRNVVHDIYRWLRREMTSEQGAFFSAIDSGEVGKEGEAYVWKQDEVLEVLGPAAGELFTQVYNFESRGNFLEEATRQRSGTNIPHLKQPIAELSDQMKHDPLLLQQQLAEMREQLLVRRQTWEQPHKDDKVLTSWNGLMIASLAYAGRQLEEPQYTEAAVRAAEFIYHHMTDNGNLMRVYRAGQSKQPGYLDDYAFYSQGLIELYLATKEAVWLDRAKEMAQIIIDDFQDHQHGGFYFSRATHDPLITRSKNLNGGGNMPNASGAAASVLLQLHQLTDVAIYLQVAGRALESLAGLMADQPSGSEDLLVAAGDYFALRPATADPMNQTVDRYQAGIAQSPPAESNGDRETHQGELSGPDTKRRTESVTIEVYVSRLRIRPGEQIDLAIVLDIDEGWHLYAENPEAQFLVPSSLSIKATDQITVGELEVPEPDRMVDPILKQELRTFAGRVWYRVPVHIAESASSGAVSLELIVNTQACDDSRCLPPQTTRIELPLSINPDADQELRHPWLFGGNDP